MWGYVEGGMGMVSFAIADAALDSGAKIACGVPVARIHPGEGVETEDGTRLHADHVLCNADPKAALGMLDGADLPADYRARLQAWKIRSPVVKFNASLSRLPNWTAAPGELWPAQGTVDVTTGMQDAQRAFERCAAGEPAVGFGEIYVQTGHDPSPAPPGHHLLSVFGQYAPYEIAEGDWESRRGDVHDQFVALISRFAPDFAECLEDSEVLGPPDIESRIGLTGGNIFQGEVTPDQMWEGRLSARTPVPGLYLCGAATHPAGSVIALNGRNAAAALLHDLGESAAMSGPARGGVGGGPLGSVPCPPSARTPASASSRRRATSSPPRESMTCALPEWRCGPAPRLRSCTTTSPPARSCLEQAVLHSFELAADERFAEDAEQSATAAAALAQAIDECLPLPGRLRRDWVLWVELWLRAAREPSLRPLAARLYARYHEWLQEVIARGIERRRVPRAGRSWRPHRHDSGPARRGRPARPARRPGDGDRHRARESGHLPRRRARDRCRAAAGGRRVPPVSGANDRFRGLLNRRSSYAREGGWTR